VVLLSRMTSAPAGVLFHDHQRIDRSEVHGQCCFAPGGNIDRASFGRGKPDLLTEMVCCPTLRPLRFNGVIQLGSPPAIQLDLRALRSGIDLY